MTELVEEERFRLAIIMSLSSSSPVWGTLALQVYVPPSVLLIADLNSSCGPFRVLVPFSNCQKYLAGGKA